MRPFRLPNSALFDSSLVRQGLPRWRAVKQRPFFFLFCLA